MLAEDQLKAKISLTQVWERVGITRHFGGVYATEELIKLCGIRPGICVLVIGSGSGYTPYLLAKKYGAKVTALDIIPELLEAVMERAAKGGVINRVKVVQADAHHLPFDAATFDVVIIEAVLVFCDAKTVVSEAYRVLKPRGVLGSNETTYITRPPESLDRYFSHSLGTNMKLYEENEWVGIFESAGFRVESHVARKPDIRKEAVSQLIIYGPRKLLSARVKMVLDSDIRGTYRELLTKWQKYLSYAGYGIYVMRKS